MHFNKPFRKYFTKNLHNIIIDNRGKIYWRKGMSINDVFRANRDFLAAMQERYKRERGYTIDPNIIRTALQWFVTRMGNMEVEE